MSTERSSQVSMCSQSDRQVTLGWLKVIHEASGRWTWGIQQWMAKLAKFLYGKSMGITVCCSLRILIWCAKFAWFFCWHWVFDFGLTKYCKIATFSTKESPKWHGQPFFVFRTFRDLLSALAPAERNAKPKQLWRFDSPWQKLDSS